MAASSPTFGPQWPHRNPHIVTLTRRDGLRIPIHKELLHLVSMLMDLTENDGLRHQARSDLGLRKPGYQRHPHTEQPQPGLRHRHQRPVEPVRVGRRGIGATPTPIPFGLPRRTDIPQKVFELWERHGFSLGVKYQTKPDPMHFEFTQTLTECRRITQRLAQSMNAKPPKPKPKPQPKPEEDDDMPKPLLLRLTAKDPADPLHVSARTVHWVKSGEALQGYKFDMQNNGLSRCRLRAQPDLADDKGQLEELHDFVINLPFIGEWPTSTARPPE